MAPADIRNDCGLRACDLRQTVHLAEIVDSHLENRHLIFLTQTENSERQAQLIVEVRIRFQHTVFLRQHRRDRLFCAGLSNASRNADNRNIELLHIVFCHCFNGLHGILHEDIRAWRCFKCLLGNDSKCALGSHVRDKFMAVHTLTRNCNEEASLSRFPAVRHDIRDFRCFLFFRSEVSSAAHLCNVRKSHIFHALLPLFLRESWISSSQSSG